MLSQHFFHQISSVTFAWCNTHSEKPRLKCGTPDLSCSPVLARHRTEKCTWVALGLGLPHSAGSGHILCCLPSAPGSIVQLLDDCGFSPKVVAGDCCNPYVSMCPALLQKRPSSLTSTFEQHTSVFDFRVLERQAHFSLHPVLIACATNFDPNEQQRVRSDGSEGVMVAMDALSRSCVRGRKEPFVGHQPLHRSRSCDFFVLHMGDHFCHGFA